jgi:hypothetical protein
MNIKQKIMQSKILRKLYGGVWYFELGRGQCSRIYGYIPEIMMILMGLKFLFKIEFTTPQLIILFIAVFVSFITIGLIYKKSGLYDKERSVQNSKDPIMNEVLNNTRKIK